MSKSLSSYLMHLLGGEPEKLEPPKRDKLDEYVIGLSTRVIKDMEKQAEELREKLVIYDCALTEILHLPEDYERAVGIAGKALKDGEDLSHKYFMKEMEKLISP